ncbi:hypothetical protein WICPIJ_000287 [Wickerhamomyces pijperi]|uniref:UBC core domain-containing protein n=1 Tax=Wickerhamomyces pijperi TaxID=599730 RepID=A0A9P8QD46_WICPI|nr:hypothetical protein WICPIJ_000287 [Wickerhamomyces pijperi]
MATPMAIKRLTKEFKDLEEKPVPYIEAHPSESNILNWYFILTGPPDTPYVGGTYLGMLMFHRNYPFEPPGIKVITPSGRFVPNSKICLSISDFHRETWNPSFSVGTILNGLLSFMTSEEGTTGAMRCGSADRKIYATKSHAFNKTNAIFQTEFPDYYDLNSDKNKEVKDAEIKEPEVVAAEVNGATNTKKSIIEKVPIFGQVYKRKPSNDNQLNENVKRVISSSTSPKQVIDLEAEEQERKIRETTKDEVIDLDSEDEDDFNFFEDEDGAECEDELLVSEDEGDDNDLVEIAVNGKHHANDDKLKGNGTEEDAIVID